MNINQIITNYSNDKQKKMYLLLNYMKPFLLMGRFFLITLYTYKTKTLNVNIKIEDKFEVELS